MSSPTPCPRLSGAPGPRAPPLGLARLRGEAREAGAGQRPGGAGLRRFAPGPSFFFFFSQRSQGLRWIRWGFSGGWF